MAADWHRIGQARWYDCKLGKLFDTDLARIVGTRTAIVRQRRVLFGIPACTVAKLIEPYRHLLGVMTDRKISALCGVSSNSVNTYRRSLGIPALTTWAKPVEPSPLKQNLPLDHPVRPYKALLGYVADSEIASAAGVRVSVVRKVRVALGYAPSAPTPKPPPPVRFRDSPGPLLGYESLFATMSSVKVSRTVGVPYTIVEARRLAIGAPAYVRASRLERYKHLLGVVPHYALARLVGLSQSRVTDLYKQQLERSGSAELENDHTSMPGETAP